MIVIRKVNPVIRILCGCIDFIIVMIPIQFIMMGYFEISLSQADLLFMMLFAVYGTLFSEYWGGKTIGKYFGKIRVTTNDGEKPSIMYIGMRELAKALYLIPYIGWGLALISLGMISFGKGKALHDWIGNTRVCYIFDENEES